MVAQSLIFPIRQRLGRSHGDGVARVDAHRIQILDAADNHDVVRLIAHHLEFKFLPPEQRLFDQDLGDRTGFQSAFADGGVFLRVVRDSPSTAAQGEGRSDDSRKAADGSPNGFSFLQG